MTNEEPKWFFKSYADFLRIINENKLSKIEIASFYENENLIRFHIWDTSNEFSEYPSVAVFDTNKNIQVVEYWSNIKSALYHRINKPAVIIEKDYYGKSEQISQYWYHGIQHGGPFVNGQKFHYGRIHGDIYSNWYYGLETFPKRFKSEQSRLKAVEAMTLELCQPLEYEDLKNQFAAYYIMKSLKNKPNMAPIHSMKEMILWLENCRPDLNFDSDFTISEMIKEKAMKVFHKVTSQELKILKRFGSQVMFYWREASRQSSPKSSLLIKLENNVSEPIKNEILSWLTEENLGF